MIPHGTFHMELLGGPHHQGVPSGLSKMISEPMVRSAQTVHLSCIKVSTISKRTKSSFHLSLVTMEYHWFHPKRFLSLSYVWCKLFTYLEPTLTSSPNGPKQIPHEPSRLGVTSGPSKMIFERVIHSAQSVHLSFVKISTIFIWTESSFHLSLVT
jgi:hypothetical protein